MTPARVLIVEDSAVMRTLVCELIEADPRLRVAAAVDRVESALDLVRRGSADVVSLDLRLPGMTGMDFIAAAMSEHPVPIVVLSSALGRGGLSAIQALRAGAVAVVEKPPSPHDPSFERAGATLCTQLAIMSGLRLVRRRDGAVPAAAAPPDPPPGPPLGAFRSSVLGVVASTGGPRALERLFNVIGRPLDAPILLVQHMTPAFVENFVTWLGSVVPMPVVLARHGEAPRHGLIHMAPPGAHLELRRGLLAVGGSDPVDGHAPSGTVLLRSLAEETGGAAAGVVLTGMGVDGAAGLARIREAGGATFAEDPSTAVVDGMPGAARRLGAARWVLPLDELGTTLPGLFSPPRPPPSLERRQSQPKEIP
ncbi:MAG: chemotaxis protein CheB [Longimicrobiales bacterium]